MKSVAVLGCDKQDKERAATGIYPSAALFLSLRQGISWSDGDPLDFTIRQAPSISYSKCAVTAFETVPLAKLVPSFPLKAHTFGAWLSW